MMLQVIEDIYDISTGAATKHCSTVSGGRSPQIIYLCNRNNTTV